MGQENRSVNCLRCGLMNDFYTVVSGPHIKAVCNGCNKYIKFLSKEEIELLTAPDRNPAIKKMAETKKEGDNLLPGGLRFFNAAATAPDFVMGNLIITPRALVDYIKQNPQLLTEYEGEKQLKVQLLVSKAGNLYGRVDEYKKEEKPEGRTPVKPGTVKEQTSQAPASLDEDDLPF